MAKTMQFHERLKKVMDDFVHRVYDVSDSFLNNEMFSLTTQLRRAALSIVFNYIEGFARQRNAVMRNFFEISYGSLKEAKYLVYFSYKRKYISESDYKKLIDQAEEIRRILWRTLEKL